MRILTVQISEAISSHIHLTTSIKKSTNLQVFIHTKKSLKSGKKTRKTKLHQIYRMATLSVKHFQYLSGCVITTYTTTAVSQLRK